MNLTVTNRGSEHRASYALIVYTQEGGDCYVTKNPVTVVGGKPLIRAGRPLTVDDYRSLIDGLKPKERPSVEWLDPQVLAKGLGRTIWWTKPQKRAMFFKKSAMGQHAFSGNGHLPNPGLVFMATEDSLFIYAFKGSDAPSRETQLYQCPMFNVWATGLVCVGNAELPAPEQRGNPDAWERFFFGSRFTHPNVHKPGRLTHGINPVDFWKQQLERPSDSFPEEVLVDVNLTVNDLLDANFSGSREGNDMDGDN